jgi:endonuclease YncB( thermonuclease family)
MYLCNNKLGEIMKKYFSLALFISVLLVSCSDSSTLSSSDSSSSEIPLPTLVISKVITATASRNNIIELYNPTSDTILLMGITLDFYSNGSQEITAQIPLEGTLNGESYFVLGSASNDIEGMLELMDYVHPSGILPYNGNDAFELVFDNRVIDAIGIKGFDIVFSGNKTLIRLGERSEYLPSSTYNQFNFISYLPDQFQYIKNDDHEIKTHEALYDGPRLEERYASYPFVKEGTTNAGGGGYVQVTNISIADGDTASFSPSGSFTGGSVRYYYINTPEVDGNYVRAEPWGYVASKYNKEFIMKNPSQSTFYIQSLLGESLKEVNNRSLGLVWVNGQLSQFLIVREGLSEDVSILYSAIDIAMSYKNVPYLFFLQYAEHFAKLNGWGTKGFPSNPEGEKSPDWNYSAAGGVGALATTDPIWQPKIPLPWN